MLNAVAFIGKSARKSNIKGNAIESFFFIVFLLLSFNKAYSLWGNMVKHSEERKIQQGLF